MRKFRDYLSEKSNLQTGFGKTGLLTEASFKIEDLKKVASNIGSLLGKGLGGAFKVWTTEDFERDNERGQGVRLLNAKGYGLRLNFSDKINGFANNKSVVLSSVDFWDAGNVDLECPDVTCRFNQEVNIIQIWTKLSDIIFNKKYGKYTAGDLGAEPVNEEIAKGSIRTRKDFLASKGIALWKGEVRRQFDSAIAQGGYEAEWNAYVAQVEPGRPETNSTEERMKRAETKLKETKFADPDVIFKDLVTLTKMFKSGKRKLLTVCGQGGLGKCIDVDTLVATPNGYLRAGDIKVGDTVFTPKNTVANVLEVYPQSQKKECYKVTLSDGRSVVADEEQLFNVKITKNFENIQLKDIMEAFKSGDVIFPVCDKDFVRSELPLKDIQPVGLRDTVCFLIDDPDHLFVTSEFMVVHNTFEIYHTLSDMFGASPNKEWIYIPAGKFTTLQFYQEVFMARDRIICFDEADNLVKNDQIVTMLKPALDTSGDNQFTYNTGTKRMTDMSKKQVEEYCQICDDALDQGVPFAVGKRFGRKDNIIGYEGFLEDDPATGVWLPSRFFFTGKMILISNLPLKEIDSALRTRGPAMDITLTLEGKIKRIETVLKNMGHNPETIAEIIEQLEKQDDPELISIRTAVAYIDFMASGFVTRQEAARLSACYG